MITGHTSGRASDLGGTDSFETYSEPGDDGCDHTGEFPSMKWDGGASKGIPLYRKPSFLICQAVILVVGFALLFVLLYPVVGAIAQHIVNVSKLNVDRVAITGPTNSS